MKPQRLLPLVSILLCAACFDGGEGDYFVEATIDGEAYEGNVGGAHLFQAEPSWMLFFPSDLLQIGVYGWAGGETGSWDLVFEEGCEEGCSWALYQLGTATYVSDSGTLTIDEWEDHEPDNAADTRIGYAGGTFDSTLSCWMGCEGAAETVEITDGAFYVQVAASDAE